MYATYKKVSYPGKNLGEVPTNRGTEAKEVYP